jgi:hypothetical protein
MTDFTYLKMAETRRDNLKQYHPGSGEYMRLEGIVADMISGLNPDEIQAYADSKVIVETSKEKADRIKLELKAMEANTDKPSH